MRFTADAVAIWLAFIFGLVLADLWLIAEQSGRARSSDEVHSADDGWRRTAHGWERASNWPAQPIDALRACFEVQDDAAPRARWDFHPAWLAVIQLSVVAAAVVLLPNRRPKIDSRD